MIKKLIAALLAAVLTVSLSGCSLTDFTETGGTQADNNTEQTLASNEIESIGEAVVIETPTPTQQAVEGKLIKVALYFPNKGNSALMKEERNVRVVNGAILRATVEALIKGPETEGLHNAIPEGTVLNGINIKEKVAIVDFSKEFAAANDIAGVVERLSIVNTLTGITGVEKVRIRIDGKELTGSDGEPLGDLSPAQMDDDGLPAQN